MATAALLFALASGVLGLGFGPLRRWEMFERWALALTGSVLALAVVSLALVRMEAYSPVLAGLISATLGGLAFGSARRAGELPAPEGPARAPEEVWIVTPVLVLLFALYAFFPTYSLLGGQDPGVYLTYSGHIARTGGLHLDLPWLRDLAKEHPHGFALAYPGVYSLVNHEVGTDVTRLSPQFMHLFPALAANLWSAFGLEGAVRVNAPVAVLALAGGYAFVRRLAGFGPALAFVLVLGLNPAFLWGARITLTETLAFLLNIVGLWLLLAAGPRTPRFVSIAAGVVLGLGVLNRLDAVLASLALAGLAVAALLDRSLLRHARGAAVAFLIVSLVGLGDAFVNVPFYLLGLAEDGNVLGFLGANVAVSVVATLALFLPARVLDALVPPRSIVTRLGDELVVLTAAWVAIALFAWPEVDASRDARAARELTWYVTPIAWPLTLLGLFRLLRSTPRALPFAVLALASLVLFTVQTQSKPVHIWASRRWLPQVIPSMAILAAIATGWLASVTARTPLVRALVVAVPALCYLAPTLLFDRIFAFRTMLKGLPAAYEAVAARVRASGARLPLVTADQNLASVLTYVYDVPTALIGTDREFGVKADVSERMLLRGDYGGMPAIGLDAFGLGNTVSDSAYFAGTFLETTDVQPPRKLIPFPVILDMGVLGGKKRSLEVPARHPSLTTNIGVPGPGGSVVSSGRAGLLQGGPCITVGPGNYAVDWIGRVQERGAAHQQGTLDVVSDPKQTVVAALPLRVRGTGVSETWLGGLDFTTDRTLRCVEFRLQVEKGVAMTLTRLRFARTADTSR